jgi:malonyl-CoA O-methyltransferase
MLGDPRTIIDKEAIRENFSRAASRYDQWAEAQRRIARRLSQICPAAEGIASVLELGCGTGIFTEHVRRLYPAAELVALDIAPGMIDHCRRRWGHDPLATFVQADAESYLPPAPFDLICASCSLQWFSDPDAAVRQMAACLRPGGRLALAVLVLGTAAELVESYRAALGRPMPGLAFSSAEAWLDRLARSGLRLERQSIETVRLDFSDPFQVLQSFKGLGATFGRHRWSRPLSVGQLKRLLVEYQRRFATERACVPLSYRVLYVLLTASSDKFVFAETWGDQR